MSVFRIPISAAPLGIALLLFLIGNPVFSSVGPEIENALLAKDWRTAVILLEKMDIEANATAAFLHEVCCLATDMDCAESTLDNHGHEPRPDPVTEQWVREFVAKHRQSSVAHFIDGSYKARAVGLVQATIALTKAISLDSTLAVAYLQRSTLRALNRYYVLAAEDCETAVRLRPDYCKALTSLGGAYNNLELYDKSVVTLKRALEKGCDSAIAWYNLGNAYRRMGNNLDGIAAYTAAIEQDSSFAVAYYNRGNLYIDHGDTLKAINDYEQFCDRATPEMEHWIVQARQKLARLRK